MKQPYTLTFAKAMRAGCDAVVEACDRLDQLDAIVGDGEHGTNMSKCLRSVKEKLADGDYATLSDEITVIGQTLLAAGGGTASTLMGMFFVYAQTRMKAAPNDGPDKIVRFAYDAVKKRSQAEVGDKTMIDALDPAAAAFENSIKNDPESVGSAIKAAAEAARQGAESTAGMLARRGRGVYAGERGKDVEDPGAVTVSLLLKAIADNWEN